MADIEKQKKSIIEKLEEASQSIEKVAFIDQNISNLKLTKLTLNGHLFRKCNFYVSKFVSCIFENCEFLNCNFSNTDILNVKFIDCTFVNCDFTEATLQDVLIEGGFKSNNIFTKIDIKDNVIGLEDIEKNLISDNTNVLSNKIEESVSDEEDYDVTVERLTSRVKDLEKHVEQLGERLENLMKEFDKHKDMHLYNYQREIDNYNVRYGGR